MSATSPRFVGLSAGFEWLSAASHSAKYASIADSRYTTRPAFRNPGGPTRRVRQVCRVRGFTPRRAANLG